ncbi:MAG: hypothetical protein ACPW60_12305 [Methylohalobius sp. ZOD2]
MYAQQCSTEIHQAIEAPSDPETRSNRGGKITTYLRWAGTLLIVVSAIGFMIQGHADLVPAYRYWVGLAFTLVLCGGGLLCAYGMRETRGARIFFGLGTAFVSVQVSQVGAMIYAWWHGQAALQPAYGWLRFIGVSPALIAVDLVLTAILMGAVSYAGFSILARRHTKRLMQAAIVGNALLLIPVRDDHWVAWLIGGLFLYGRAAEQRLHRDYAMQTWEGRAARTLLVLPLAIMIGRSLLHPVSYPLVLVLCGILAIGAIHDLKRYTRSPRLLYCGQWVGTWAALVGWRVGCEAFFGGIGGYNARLLPLSGLLFFLSGQVTYHPRLYRTFASLVAAFGACAALLEAQAWAPIVAPAVGIALTVAGMHCREKMPLLCGSICFLAGVLFYGRFAMDYFSAIPWVGTIGLGLIVILAASWLDRQDRRLFRKAGYYLQQLKSWS